MPVLDNPKHERFAQAFAKGDSADEAYARAGYKADRGNASRMTANDSIQRRVAELQERAAIKVEMTVADIVRQLAEDRDFARECGTPAAAVNATLGQAKVLGLVVDKSEAKVAATLSVDIDRPPRETREEWLARKAAEAG